MSLLVANYSDSDSTGETDTDGDVGHIVTQPKITGELKSLALPLLDTAPLVPIGKKDEKWAALDPHTKEVAFNPKYEDMFAPVAGPSNPYKTRQQRAAKNTLTGFVEKAHINDFHFEAERKTYHTFGYAQNPSADATGFAGDKKAGEAAKGETVLGSKKTGKEKRKMDNNWDAADVEGYTGPWGKYVDEERVARPDEELLKEMDTYKLKRKKYTKVTKDEETTETSMLHLKDMSDYAGRTFMEAPKDSGTNLREDFVPSRCYVPKKLIHTYSGHSAKGIQVIRWLPKSAHLILSGGMDSKVKLWDVYGSRKCIRTYSGHKMAIRDAMFNNQGDEFCSASFDRYIKLWDTETGQCKQRFTTGKVPLCITYNPDPDKNHMILTGMMSKKIIQWDTRSGEIVQEYDRHIGPVNSINFFDDARRFYSTSDDKSVRIWEWELPVDTKTIQDAGLHSMPFTKISPDKKWMIGQCMDNRIVMFNFNDDKLRFAKRRAFRGHMTSGYACGVDFSADMSYISSGDSNGRVFVWNWKTHRMEARWRAHDKVCIATLWHPHETSMMATAGWDGMIKLWS